MGRSLVPSPRPGTNRVLTQQFLNHLRSWHVANTQWSPQSNSLFYHCGNTVVKCSNRNLNQTHVTHPHSLFVARHFVQLGRISDPTSYCCSRSLYLPSMAEAPSEKTPTLSEVTFSFFFIFQSIQCLRFRRSIWLVEFYFWWVKVACNQAWIFALV